MGDEGVRERWVCGWMTWLSRILLITDSCANSPDPQTSTSARPTLTSVHTHASTFPAPTSASVPLGTPSRASSSAKVTTPSSHVVLSHA